MGNLDEFNRELAEKNLLGFWNAGNRPEVYEPKASYEPCIWRWEDVYSSLMKAGELLTLDQTARRFIGFLTPSKFRTTHTLAMGVQLVNPGEVAEAHRHTMAAIRFVLRGGGAQTTVNGEAFPMEAGDLVTTPNRSWHDHYNGSSQPIIWIDGTDLPMVKFFEISFGDLYPSKQQEISRPRDYAIHELGPTRAKWIGAESIQPPPYRYRWQDTEKTLMAVGESPGDPFDGIILRYINPLTGGSTLPTLSCEIQMLRRGERTGSHRHTSSTICHAFRGSGVTTVEDRVFEWQEGDSFTIPQWQWHHHSNPSGQAAILFVMNDKPVLDALGFYREETR
jgi:gentisate 1,2-dioxygenase